MKKVIKYEANDGKLFDTEKEALKRDELLGEIKKLVKLVHGENQSCEFQNGEGFYQVTKENYDLCLKEFELLLKKHESWIFDIGQVVNPIGGYVGRCLSDGRSPLYHLYSVITRIDKDYRLWGQLFFCLNPQEGKQKRLN